MRDLHKASFFFVFIAFGVNAVVNSFLYVVSSTLLYELLLTQTHTKGHISTLSLLLLINRYVLYIPVNN